MIYFRIYAPGIEQGLFTAFDLKERYGLQWKKKIKHFICEVVNTDSWFQQFKNKDYVVQSK